ncbi:hypothetical protein G6F36_012314 [Rhizopus arrhizus]|nr:hypothetical protein G6F36_012314 [Rhizopus arrhizus]
MRSTLVFLGLFSVFMLVSSLPFAPATLGNGQANGPTDATSGGPTGGGNNGNNGHRGLLRLGLALPSFNSQNSSSIPDIL